MGKPISVWTNNEEENLIRKMAKKNNKSVSKFIKIKCGVLKKKKKNE